jgi:hypothetical protein
MSAETRFADPLAATRFRDVVRGICRSVLRTERPGDTYAVVQSIDRANRRAVVRYPGETVDITLPMGAVQPSAVGDSVRVKGMPADRHIDEPVGNFFIPGATLIGTAAARLLVTNLITGMTFYETDTKRLYVYDGTNWIVPYPLGRIGLASMTSNSASFGGAIIYPLTLSNVAIIANRKIKVYVHANVQSASAGVHVSISACDVNGTIASQAYRVLSSGGLQEQITAEWCFSQVAATTFGCRLGAYASTTTFIAAGATAHTYLAVYDEGPV